MIIDLMTLSNVNTTTTTEVKRVSSYELAKFLKSYPEDSVISIWETMMDQYGYVPPTWWLVERIVAEYGHDPIWIKVPASLLGLVEAVKQPPKRRWRIIGKMKRRNPTLHQPWWMKWWSSFIIMWQCQRYCRIIFFWFSNRIYYL